jgi:hypothetical protein
MRRGAYKDLILIDFYEDSTTPGRTKRSRRPADTNPAQDEFIAAGTCPVGSHSPIRAAGSTPGLPGAGNESSRRASRCFM